MVKSDFILVIVLFVIFADCASIRTRKSNVNKSEFDKGRIFGSYIGDFISGSDWFPIEFNVPDILSGFGSGLSSMWSYLIGSGGGGVGSASTATKNNQKDEINDEDDDDEEEDDEDDDDDDEDDELADEPDFDLVNAIIDNNDESENVSKKKIKNTLITKPNGETNLKKEKPVWVVVLNKNINDVDIDNLGNNDVKVIEDKIVYDENNDNLDENNDEEDVEYNNTEEYTSDNNEDVDDDEEEENENNVGIDTNLDDEDPDSDYNSIIDDASYYYDSLKRKKKSKTPPVKPYTYLPRPFSSWF